MSRIEGKVRGYRALAQAYEVPLVVGVQFDAGDPYIGSQAVSMEPVSPWRWPEDLAGLLWIENQLPFRLVVRPNPGARRQLPQGLRPSD